MVKDVGVGFRRFETLAHFGNNFFKEPKR